MTHIPDAPESVKYHGDYDPSDPPHEDYEHIPGMVGFCDGCGKPTGGPTETGFCVECEDRINAIYSSEEIGRT